LESKEAPEPHASLAGSARSLETFAVRETATD
jgi:hypothetical protein